jgi:hypothetical protein
MLYGSLKTGLDLPSETLYVHHIVGTGQYNIVVNKVKEPPISTF